MIEGKSSIYRKVIISVMARNKVHMNTCLIPNGYLDRAFGTYKYKNTVNGSNKEKLLTVNLILILFKYLNDNFVTPK